jgi:hypothetical protein
VKIGLGSCVRFGHGRLFWSHRASGVTALPEVIGFRPNPAPGLDAASARKICISKAMVDVLIFVND